LEVKSESKMSVLGVMSGTSLDGLDLALCEFAPEGKRYTFAIRHARTIAYTDDWKKRLTDVKNASAEDFFALHAAYGKFIADEALVFFKTIKLTPHVISSHGHTVFHRPGLGFSTQIGCGATIAAHTTLTTVCDFRSLDVASGGQGAPLVPVGDKLLFGEREACLNIGGIANISFDKAGERVAYDVGVANMLLNYLAEQTGAAYDKGGELARSGSVDGGLLTQLNGLDYYSQEGARSIGREWFEQNIKPLVDKTARVEDRLATSVEHIAQVIAAELNKHKIKSVLITGGGVFNTFLITRLRTKTNCELIIPTDEIVNFKEALIFAFLGYLRLNEKVNTLSSVTGASHDSIGGAVYLGRQ
jgi:anhydro-N-acetylmuramic acid kinase